MIYSKEVFSQAEIEINRRHISALAENENRQHEIEMNAPEIAAINNQLMQTSIEISKAILKNNNNLKANLEKIKQTNLDGQKLIKTLLLDFSYPINYLDLHFSCSKCDDTGYVSGIRCQCFNELLKKYSVQELNKNCNIKLTQFENFDLNYYPDTADVITKVNPRLKMTENLNYCKQYANSFSSASNSIFMLGKTGLGKTYLSASIANSLLQKGFNVAFDSIQNYLRAIENEHFGRSQNSDTLQVLLDTDLVILDDLGSEFLSPFYLSTIYNIMNSRLNRGVPTIISTNMSFDELQSRYDDRIISRLTGMFTCLRFFGADVRQIKRRNGDI